MSVNYQLQISPPPIISTHKKLLILLERGEALMFLRRNSGQKWNRPSSKDFPQGSISWAH